MISNVNVRFSTLPIVPHGAQLDVQDDDGGEAVVVLQGGASLDVDCVVGFFLVHEVEDLF